MISQARLASIASSLSLLKPLLLSSSSILSVKIKQVVLPADRCRDTRTAVECSFRSKNCGSRFQAGTISDKNP